MPASRLLHLGAVIKENQDKHRHRDTATVDLIPEVVLSDQQAGYAGHRDGARQLRFQHDLFISRVFYLLFSG